MAYLVSPNDFRPVYGKFLDGKPGKITPVDSIKYHNVPGAGRPVRHNMNYGLPVRTENVPTKFQLEKKKQILHPMSCTGGLWMISPKARETIEELEPDTHQFFPVEVLSKSGEFLDQFFLFNICNRQESVDFEKSVLIETRRKDGSLSSVTADSPRILYVRREEIKDRHAWHEKWFVAGSAFLSSDQLVKSLKDAKSFTGTLDKVGEI